jgi:nitroreductase
LADILTHIFARRSIRKYTEEPVAADDIERLLQAAMAAPSASNRKPWEFVVVTEPELLERLRSGLIFARYAAPLAIAVCGNMQRAWPGPGRDLWVEDCSAATQNILLASAGLGLGAVWIGVHPIAPFVKTVSRILALPNHVIPLCVVYVGHPAEHKESRTQYEAARVFWQQYTPRKLRRKKGERPEAES